MLAKRIRPLLFAHLSGAFFLAGAVLAEEPYVPPPMPKLDNTIMAQAFRSVPMACRIQVQKVLAKYNFYGGEIDGSWGPATATAIGLYASAAPGVGYGFVSIQGAKGALWHIGFEEIECPMPPYDS